MRYYVLLDELENVGNELLHYNRNEINDKILELEKYQELFEWEGVGHDSFIKSYNDEINKLKILNEKIEKLGNFIINFQNEYSETNNKLGNLWEEYLDDNKESSDLDGM